MSLTKTPICDFGKQAENFKLKSTDGKFLTFKMEDANLTAFVESFFNSKMGYCFSATIFNAKQ